MPELKKILAIDKLQTLLKIIKWNGGVIKSIQKLYRQDTLKHGTFVGKDQFGNKYFENKEYFMGRTRWVEYAENKGLNYDATQIPSEWFGWIHYKTDLIPELDPHRPKYKWMASHSPNMSGTSEQYVPYSTTLPKIHAWEPPSSKKVGPHSSSSFAENASERECGLIISQRSYSKYLSNLKSDTVILARRRRIHNSQDQDCTKNTPDAEKKATNSGNVQTPDSGQNKESQPPKNDPKSQNEPDASLQNAEKCLDKKHYSSGEKVSKNHKNYKGNGTVTSKETIVNRLTNPLPEETSKFINKLLSEEVRENDQLPDGPDVVKILNELNEVVRNAMETEKGDEIDDCPEILPLRASEPKAKVVDNNPIIVSQRNLDDQINRENLLTTNLLESANSKTVTTINRPKEIPNADICNSTVNKEENFSKEKYSKKIKLSNQNNEKELSENHVNRAMQALKEKNKTKSEINYLNINDHPYNEYGLKRAIDSKIMQIIKENSKRDIAEDSLPEIKFVIIPPLGSKTSEIKIDKGKTSDKQQVKTKEREKYQENSEKHLGIEDTDYEESTKGTESQKKKKKSYHVICFETKDLENILKSEELDKFQEKEEKEIIARPSPRKNLRKNLDVVKLIRQNIIHNEKIKEQSNLEDEKVLRKPIGKQGKVVENNVDNNFDVTSQILRKSDKHFIRDAPNSQYEIKSNVSKYKRDSPQSVLKAVIHALENREQRIRNEKQILESYRSLLNLMKLNSREKDEITEGFISENESKRLPDHTKKYEDFQKRIISNNRRKQKLLNVVNVNSCLKSEETVSPLSKNTENRSNLSYFNTENDETKMGKRIEANRSYANKMDDGKQIDKYFTSQHHLDLVKKEGKPNNNVFKSRPKERTEKTPSYIQTKLRRKHYSQTVKDIVNETLSDLMNKMSNRSRLLHQDRTESEKSESSKYDKVLFKFKEDSGHKVDNTKPKTTKKKSINKASTDCDEKNASGNIERTVDENGSESSSIHSADRNLKKQVEDLYESKTNSKEDVAQKLLSKLKERTYIKNLEEPSVPVSLDDLFGRKSKHHVDTNDNYDVIKKVLDGKSNYKRIKLVKKSKENMEGDKSNKSEDYSWQDMQSVSDSDEKKLQTNRKVEKYIKGGRNNQEVMKYKRNAYSNKIERIMDGINKPKNVEERAFCSTGDEVNMSVIEKNNSIGRILKEFEDKMIIKEPNNIKVNRKERIGSTFATNSSNNILMHITVNELITKICNSLVNTLEEKDKSKNKFP